MVALHRDNNIRRCRNGLDDTCAKEKKLESCFVLPYISRWTRLC